MPQFNISTGIPQLPSGLPDEQFLLVKPLYQGVNVLSQAVAVESGAVDFTQAELAQRNQLASLTTKNHRKVYAKNAGGTALGYGKVVHLYLSAGVISAEYADSTTNAKPAHGIVNNPLGIDAGDFGEIVIIEGHSQGIAGTTFGLYYYLSTNGDVQSARPAVAGSIVQSCGFGLGTAGFYLHISSYFQQN